MRRQPELFNIGTGKSEVSQNSCEESGFLVSWEGREHCVACIYDMDYKELKSTSSAFSRISPIATSFNICSLKWKFNYSTPCKYYCQNLGREMQNIDLDSSKTVISKLNKEIGLQYLEAFEQQKTPLNLLRLQQFLADHGYRLNKWSGLQSICKQYYGGQPVRFEPCDYWSKSDRLAVCTVLALEFIRDHNGCQISSIEMYTDSINWTKKEGVKPDIKALRKHGFIKTSHKPRFVGGFDPSTKTEITEKGNNVLNSISEAAVGLLKFTNKNEYCTMLELKTYWYKNYDDVFRAFILLGMVPNLQNDELIWHLPILAPMIWTGYLEVGYESPLKGIAYDENIVRLTQKGQQQCSKTGSLLLKSFYMEN